MCIVGDPPPSVVDVRGPVLVSTTPRRVEIFWSKMVFFPRRKTSTKFKVQKILAAFDWGNPPLCFDKWTLGSPANAPFFLFITIPNHSSVCPPTMGNFGGFFCRALPPPTRQKANHFERKPYPPILFPSRSGNCQGAF